MKGEKLKVIIMAGGAGSRYGGPHKLVARICGDRVIDRVIRISLAIGDPVIVLSSYTRGYLTEICGKYRCIETGGAGYPQDLLEALSIVGRPAVILPGDLPFISLDTLLDFIERAFSYSEPIVTMRACRDDVCEAVGVSLAKDHGWGWANIDYIYTHELVDIDTQEDLLRAEEICGSTVENKK